MLVMVIPQRHYSLEKKICHIHCQVSHTPSHTLSEKDIYWNITYIVRCPIPWHIPCNKRIFSVMSHTLSGIIYPVTYIVRIGKLQRCHIYCQVSYTPSHTLSEKDSYWNITYIVRCHIPCHIHCQNRKITQVSHTLSGVIHPVTNFVRTC